MTGEAAPELDEQEHRRGIALTRQRGFGEGRGGAKGGEVAGGRPSLGTVDGARGRAARRPAAGRRWEPSRLESSGVCAANRVRRRGGASRSYREKIRRLT